VARGKIGDPSLKDRVAIVSMDASLFENTLIEEAQRRLRLHPEDIDRAFQSVVAMNRRAGEGDPGLLTDTRLPIEKNSVDFVVSSMTLSQFMVGYIQLLVKMFLEHYGSKRTREYFLSESRPGVGSDGSHKIEELQHSTSALARRATAKHLSELGRIAKPGGVVILSDHTLHGRCVLVNEEEVEVDVPSLIPYSKNLQEDKTLRCREDPKQPLPAALRVDRTKPDTVFVVEGNDAMKSILEQDGGMKILDEQGWWWVTERAKGAEEGSPVWNISYVEAFTLLSRI
jgi:SAM-dependent methyltransferase